MLDIFSSCSPLVLCFQATGMEMNLSKNVISCGDPGMTCSFIGLIIKLLLREVEFFHIVWLCILFVAKLLCIKPKDAVVFVRSKLRTRFLVNFTTYGDVYAHRHLAFKNKKRIKAHGIRTRWDASGSARKSNESTLTQVYNIFNTVS